MQNPSWPFSLSPTVPMRILLQAPPRDPRWGPTPPRSLLAVLALLVVTATGCDGSNAFVPRPLPEPPPPPADATAETLRYLEEGLLLTSDESRLRFRWMDREPRLAFASGVPPREREAFARAIQLLADAGGPQIQVVESAGAIQPSVVVEAHPPDAYRALDPTRPWSFSRSYVTATPEEGITEVRILVSLELETPVLERAALHALGHTAGIMGHPAFPGDRYVMAASPDGAASPTAFHAIERAAIRFLYSEGVVAGMTRRELRDLYQARNP
jgi:hypothetical protein